MRRIIVDASVEDCTSSLSSTGRRCSRSLLERARRARLDAMYRCYPTPRGLLSNRKPARRLSGSGLLQPVDIGHRTGPADGFSTRRQAR